MSQYTETITVHIQLTTYGDALIYGDSSMNYSISGQILKQRLFAWHEASFYGTELEIQHVQDTDIILLPSEQVIPFLAERELLKHIEWIWDEAHAPWLQLIPSLAHCIEAKAYVPSFTAFQAGKLQWEWDAEALENIQPAELALLGNLEKDEQDGLIAAFSAAVFQRWYGTEAEAADLRREYPILFASNRPAAAGLDARAWLIAIGWKADTAPFRPLLQLLEPELEDDEPSWQLKLVLQDKQDPALLVPVQLADDGYASGSWPDAWTAHVRERSAGWLEGLTSILPAGQRAGSRDDVLNRPLSDEAAWQFLTTDSQHLLESGWQVLLPAWWEAATRKKPKLRAKVRPGEGAGERTKGSSLFGLDSIVQFDWRVAIGDADLSESEFAELVARNERLVRFRGQWIALDPALLAQIRRAMAGIDSAQGLSFQDILQLHLLGNADDPEGDASNEQPEDAARFRLEVELNAHLLKLISQLGQQSEWPALDVPDGLQAELRTYQRDGYAWLAFYGVLDWGPVWPMTWDLVKRCSLLLIYCTYRKLPLRRVSAPVRC